MIIAYLIRMIFCSLLFYVVYIIGLENEAIHRFKRFYLLLSIVASLLIPLCTINIPADNVLADISLAQFTAESPEAYHPEDTVYHPEKAPIGFNYSLLFAAIYAVGTSLFIYNFLKNLLRITRRKGNAFADFRGIKIVLSDHIGQVYSFYNRIYLNKQDYEKIPEEILIHESEHIRQKHTRDIIFIELVIAFFWFNPFFYLYRNKIRLNHEFLADEAVINNCTDVAGYQTLLLNEIKRNKRSIGLASNLNFVTTKKRFIMMTKKTSKWKAICRKLIVIPVIILSVVLFTEKSVANEIFPETVESFDNVIIIPGKGADEEQMKEYASIVSKYAEITDGKVIRWKSYDFSDAEIDKLYPIYIQMNAQQRIKQAIMLIGPFNTLEPQSPNVDEWNGLKKAVIVWIDGVETDPSELDKYNRKEIVNSFRLYDKQTSNYYSHVWTKQVYDKYKSGIPLEDLFKIRPHKWFVKAEGD